MFNKENVEGALSVVAYTHNSSARETMGLGGLRVGSQPVLQNASLFKTETNYIGHGPRGRLNAISLKRKKTVKDSYRHIAPPTYQWLIQPHQRSVFLQ